MDLRSVSRLRHHQRRVSHLNREPDPRRYIHVAAGVIHNDRGEVLVARRSEGAHQGGLGEFPGGKVEAGEDVSAALTRELD